MTRKPGRPPLIGEDVRAFVIAQRKLGKQMRAIAALVRAAWPHLATFDHFNVSKICRDAGVTRQPPRRKPEDLPPRRISLGGPVWSRPERFQQ